jgi:phosphate transport system substrate-binding protein
MNDVERSAVRWLDEMHPVHNVRNRGGSAQVLTRIAKPVARISAVFALVGMVATLTLAQTVAQDATPAASAYTPPADVGELEGEIVSDGSSTVGPLTIAAAENFNEFAPNVENNVTISGTGGGFERFCNGETDLQNASRAIAEDEVALCAENEVDYFEFEVAFDGITIVVPESNTFLTCISTDVLAQIWNGEVTNFNEINPDFPDLEISLFGPGTESGTYDFFNEEILGEDEAGEVIEPSAAYEPSEDDNTLVEGVAGTEGGFGYFGYSYYAEAQDRLNAVAVTPDSDLNNCVSPDPETIRSGTYTPLSRPLYIYVKASSLAEKPELQEFLRYYVADAAAIATSIGFVDAPAEDIAASLEKLEGAIAGTTPPDSQAAGS